MDKDEVNPEVPTYTDDGTPVYQTETGLSQEVERSIINVLNMFNRVDIVTGKPLLSNKTKTKMSAEYFYPLFEKDNHRAV